ncbi:monocarboxylate transporter 3-like [Glandiceps talaboti]
MNTQVYEKGISTSNNEDIENVPENGRYSPQLDSEVELNPTYMSLFDQRESNLQAEVIDNVKERAKGSEAPGCFANCKTNLKGAFDWSLFTNMAFVLIIVSGFGTQAGNYAAISHIVKRGRDYGIPSLRSSSLPALMGMTQFLGRIFWGILGGVSKKLKPAMLYGVSIAVAGTASIISIHTSTYTGQLVFVILLGVSMACFIPVFPVVLHQLLDTSKVDHAMMFYLQAQSIGATLASPVAGWMRDIEGDYDGAYYLIGMLYIVSAICAFLAPVADKYIVNRKKERSEEKCSNDTKDETEGNSQ